MIRRTRLLLSDLLRDLRHGLRLAGRRPSFSAAVGVTLGLGIGLCTAVFSVMDAVVLRPLPYANPERLVSVWETYPHWRNRPVLKEQWDRIGLAWPDYSAWRSRQHAFEEVAVFATGDMVLTGLESPHRVAVGRASSSFFEVLGIRPHRGRLLLPGDDGAAAARVVLLSHGFWQRRWGGNTGAVGRTLQLDGRPFTVIGVLPTTFRFAVEGNIRPDVWIPIGSAGESLSEGSHSFAGLARLRTGVTLEQAAAETTTILRGDRPPETRGARLQSYHQTVVGASAPRLLPVFAAAALLLLIGCVNVSALLVSETVRRGHELVTRAALGASPSRIIRQFVSETLVLSGLAASIGVAVAYVTVGALVALAPGDTPRLDEIAVDGRVLAFALAAALVTVLMATIAPGVVLLRSASRVAAHGSTRHISLPGRWSQSLVVACELAVLMVMLTAAALLARSLLRVTAVEPGFPTTNLLTVEIQLPEGGYPERSQVVGFFGRLRERVQAIPGVVALSGSSTVPFTGGSESTSVGRAGHPENTPKPEAQRRVVLPAYQRTLGVPLLTGRPLSETTVPSDTPTVVVNETMARRFWPEAPAVGQRISLRDRWYTVVGVAADVRDQNLRSTPEATYYVPQAVAREDARHMRLVVRTAVTADAIAPELRAAVASIDPGLPMGEIASMDSLIARSVAGDRFRALLVSLFAFAATFLGAVGIFGATHRVVSARRRELGVRLALGARPRQILVSVLGRTAVAATVGLIAGGATAFASSSVLEGFLYDIGARDLSTHAGTLAFLFLLSLAASWVPARRVARLELSQVLKEG
jgi:putative ABC transport system permease protein